MFHPALKRLILIFPLLAAASATNAEEHKPDEKQSTETVDVNSDSNGKETVNINVTYSHNESEFNFAFPFTRKHCKEGVNCLGKKPDRWEATCGMIGIGWNSTLDQKAGLPQRGTHSIDFFIGNLIALRYNTGRNAPSFNLGFGIDFSNWMGNRGVYTRKSPDSQSVVCSDAPEGSSRVSSRLYAFSLMFPLTIRQSLTHGFSITAGASLDITTHASVHSSYYLESVRHSQSWDGIGYNTVRYSILGSLQWHDVGIFARYSPISPIPASNGIAFRTLTVGAALVW